jgi:cellulose synthase (UDP-forming)
MLKGAWQAANPTLADQVKGIGLGWLWSAYNLIMIGIALLILLDVPRPHPYEWFDLRRVVRLKLADQIFWGVTTRVSEIGAEVALTQAGFPLLGTDQRLTVQIDIMEDGLVADGDVIWTGLRNEYPTVQVRFAPLTIDQQRQLTEMLFCRPGQWKRQYSPSELASLLLLFKILLRPRVLFDRNLDVSTIAVAKT